MGQASFHDYRRLVRGAYQFLQMLRCDCINGDGIARKRTAGKDVNQLAVVVFVNKKLGLRRLPPQSVSR